MNKVLCVGTLIIDIINAKVAKLPQEGECVTTEVTLNLGGNAYNASVNLSRLASEGTSVYCYGLVGEDDLGDLFESELEREGVTGLLSRVPGKKTSCNVILQEKGKERRYLFDEGANASASKEHLLDTIKQIQPDVLVLGELPSLGLIGADLIEIVDYAKKAYGSLVFLDLLVGPGQTYDWLSNNWSLIDIVHCNDWEGRYVTQQTTLPEICRWFVKNGVSLPVISDGANGCYYGHRDQVHHQPAFETEELDATGAGDAMTAGILTRLLELPYERKLTVNDIPPQTMADIITFASACGAIAVSALGCVGGISRDVVENLIAES
ncbi:MAG: carbohydrate kinase family protein [Anaerolineae bacterium]|nr:carbohydrate kinase family protein [Anaerolineae bacterium]